MTMGDELLLLALTPGRRRTRVRAPERLRHALRAAELAELTPHDAHRSLIERLGRTRTNIEFLMNVQRG